MQSVCLNPSAPPNPLIPLSIPPSPPQARSLLPCRISSHSSRAVSLFGGMQCATRACVYCCMEKGLLVGIYLPLRADDRGVVPDWWGYFGAGSLRALPPHTPRPKKPSSTLTTAKMKRGLGEGGGVRDWGLFPSARLCGGGRDSRRKNPKKAENYP